MKTIKVKDHRTYQLFDYQSQKNGHKYNLGDIVFKESELTENEPNPIGVIIQLHSDGDYRTEMYGNVSESEIRPATWEDIFTYAPELINHAYRSKKQFEHEGVNIQIVERGERYMNATRPMVMIRVMAPNGGQIPVRINHNDTLKAIQQKAIESMKFYAERGANVKHELTRPLKANKTTEQTI